MADNYCEGSSFLEIPEDKTEKAQVIIDRVVAELENDDDFGYCGCQAELEKTGVWFHGDESFHPDHVAEIARALVEELELDKPFYCSWAYTCSKPRIDEFGGGAFAIVRGKKTIWCDAMGFVEDQVRKENFENLEE